jgi:hypothetical protein
MKTFLAILCCILPVSAIAQPGINEMQQAQQDLNSTFFSAFDCCIVLAGLFGTFGGLRIYHNWQMGKDRIDAAVAAWLFAAFFMILSGPFLRALFGI